MTQYVLPDPSFTDSLMQEVALAYIDCSTDSNFLLTPISATHNNVLLQLPAYSRVAECAGICVVLLSPLAQSLQGPRPF